MCVCVVGKVQNPRQFFPQGCRSTTFDRCPIIQMSQELTVRNQNKAIALRQQQTVAPNRPAIVLDEDTYTDAISYIIERDFFPNLAKLRAQQEYFDAEDSGDLMRLQHAGKELRRLATTPRRARPREYSSYLY